MAIHDKYDNDILKQLTRIANSLERMEKRISDAKPIDSLRSYTTSAPVYVKADMSSTDVKPL